MGLISFFEYQKDLKDQEENTTKTMMFCLNLRYDAPLIDVMPEFRRRMEQFEGAIKLFNRFGQELPHGYHIRSDLDVYY